MQPLMARIEKASPYLGQTKKSGYLVNNGLVWTDTPAIKPMAES